MSWFNPWILIKNPGICFINLGVGKKEEGQRPEVFWVFNLPTDIITASFLDFHNEVKILNKEEARYLLSYSVTSPEVRLRGEVRGEMKRLCWALINVFGELEGKTSGAPLLLRLYF